MTSRRRLRVVPRGGKRQERDPDLQPHREALFILNYIRTSNATQSYLDAGYKCSRQVAASNSIRMLRNERVKRAVAEAQARQLAHARMSGEQAMIRASIIADLDVRRLYDATGRVLPVQEWPEDIARAVIGIEEREYGTKVTFERRLGAIMLLAESAGEIKKQSGVSDALRSFDHVRYLADKSRPK